MNGFQRRLKEVEGTFQSNCIGTALYLTGERDDDEFIRSEDAHKYLARLHQSEGPAIGHLVVWQYPIQGRVVAIHMGVVVNLDPLLITDRDRCNGPVNPKIDIYRVARECGDSTRVFYQPQNPEFNPLALPKPSTHQQHPQKALATH